MATICIFAAGMVFPSPNIVPQTLRSLPYNEAMAIHFSFQYMYIKTLKIQQNSLYVFPIDFFYQLKVGICLRMHICYFIPSDSMGRCNCVSTQRPDPGPCSLSEIYTHYRHPLLHTPITDFDTSLDWPAFYYIAPDPPLN